MHSYINQKVLVTTSGWFYTPDGKQYKAVFGTLRAIHEAGKALGFIPNRAHANWFIEIGEITIMGCQVLYIVKCDSVNTDKVKDWSFKEDTKEAIEYERPTTIYVTT